jgi:hypothetical protein
MPRPAPPALYYLAIPCPALSFPSLSCPVQSMSFPSLLCSALPYLVLPCSAMPYPVLPCLFLYYIITHINLPLPLPLPPSIFPSPSPSIFREHVNLTPFSVPCYAAVLLADIAGFTRLSSSMHAEELKRYINQFFSKILGIVETYHGDVVKFCGDALLIVWPIDADATEVGCL